MALSTEELRTLLLQHLKTRIQSDRRHCEWQFSTLLRGVDNLRSQVLGKEAEYQRGERFLTDEDGEHLKHAVWDLILARILIPGNASPTSDAGWPFISVTAHGRKVLAENKPVPYDPDGYLEELHRRAPGVHPTLVSYLQESLATFRAGAYLASVVMLGAASERLLAGLCQSISGAIGDEAKRRKFDQKANRKLKERIDTLAGWCRNHRSQLVDAWKHDEQIEVFEHLAHFIRKRRNDAGHPADPPAAPTHEQMYAWLVVFPDYCQAVWALKTDLDGKLAAIT
ncbi:MAG: hypothetical protein ACYC0Y_28085 [Pirellulales bacterium]